MESSLDQTVRQRRPRTSLIQSKVLLLVSLTQQVVRNQTKFKCAKLWLTISSKPKTCLATQLSRSSCLWENRRKLLCLQSRRISDRVQSISRLLRIFTRLRVPKSVISWPARKKTKLESKSQLPDRYWPLRWILLRLIKLQIVKLS
jgi:hypothetical protein